jgi:hypothetical protein
LNASTVLVLNEPPAGVINPSISLPAALVCFDGSNIPGTACASTVPLSSTPAHALSTVPLSPAPAPAPAPPQVDDPAAPMYPVRFMSVGSAMGINHTLRPAGYPSPRHRMPDNSRKEGATCVGHARVWQV